jgi:hypothetical protein
MSPEAQGKRKHDASSQQRKKFKKRNKCLTADVAKIFIDQLGSNSKSYVHWDLVLGIDLVVGVVVEEKESVVELEQVVVQKLVEEQGMIEELKRAFEPVLVEFALALVPLVIVGKAVPWVHRLLLMNVAYP